MKRRPILVVTVATLLTVTAGILAVAVVTRQGPRLAPPDPQQGMSEQQKLDRPKTATAKGREFVDKFQADGQDPRTLPIIRYSADGPSFDPAGAIKRADLIVHAVVGKVSFSRSPGSSLPRAVSTLKIITVYKGSPPPSPFIRVLQDGGPVPQEVGGALIMSDSDDLMLSGDEVVVLLVAFEDGYSPDLNTGIYFIRGGLVYAETGNPFHKAVDGKTLDEVVAAAKAISPQIGSR